MKKMIVILGLVFLASVTGVYAAPATADEGDAQPYTAIVPSVGAIAEWVAGFTKTYNEDGIYQAVSEVFEEGRTPAEIVTNALDVEGLNPQNLVAALYCAGAKPEDIRAATEESGISEMILVAGFEEAKTVCGDALTDSQAYTPLGPSFAGVPEGGDGGRTYGSPSTF